MIPAEDGADIGVKYDSAKPDFSMLPLKTLEPVVRVLMFGAKKYAIDNWKFVTPPSRFLSAAVRHIAASQAGEKVDAESGESHIAHAAACLIFMLWHEEAGGK